MTKVRAPLTIDAALTHIAAQIPGGWAAMAEVTGRKMSLVRSWADPDRREQIPLIDAAALDKAYQAAGGAGAPLLGWYHAQVDVPATDDPATIDAIRQLAAEAARECGEATAALFEATQANLTLAEATAARKEVEEALAVLRRALPLLVGRTPSANREAPCRAVQ